MNLSLSLSYSKHHLLSNSLQASLRLSFAGGHLFFGKGPLLGLLPAGVRSQVP